MGVVDIILDIVEGAEEGMGKSPARKRGMEGWREREKGCQSDRNVAVFCSGNGLDERHKGGGKKGQWRGRAETAKAEVDLTRDNGPAFVLHCDAPSALDVRPRLVGAAPAAGSRQQAAAASQAFVSVRASVRRISMGDWQCHRGEADFSLYAMGTDERSKTCGIRRCGDE